MTMSYHILFHTKSGNSHRCSCQLRYIFDNRGCDISHRDGVNLIISHLKLVYINLFVTVGRTRCIVEEYLLT